MLWLTYEHILQIFTSNLQLEINTARGYTGYRQYSLPTEVHIYPTIKAGLGSNCTKYSQMEANGITLTVIDYEQHCISLCVFDCSICSQIPCKML